MKKKIAIIVSTLLCFTIITSISFAEEASSEVTMTWSEQILEYVPTAIAGIVSFGGAWLGNFVVKKMLKLSVDNLSSKEFDYKDKIDQLEKALKNIVLLDNNISGIVEDLTTCKEELDKQKECIKIFATNNTNMVANGSAKQVVDILGGDSNEQQEETNN